MKVAERSNIRSKAKNLARDLTGLPFCWNLAADERLFDLGDV